MSPLINPISLKDSPFPKSTPPILENRTASLASETISGKKRKAPSLAAAKNSKGWAKIAPRSSLGQFAKKAETSLESMPRPPLAKRAKPKGTDADEITPPETPPATVVSFFPLMVVDAEVSSHFSLSPKTAEKSVDSPTSSSPPSERQLLDIFLEKTSLTKAEGGSGVPSDTSRFNYPDLLNESKTDFRWAKDSSTNLLSHSPYTEIAHRFLIDDIKEFLLSEFQKADPTNYRPSASRLVRFLGSKISSGMTESFLKTALIHALTELISSKVADEATRKHYMEEAETFITSSLSIALLFTNAMDMNTLMSQIIQKTDSLSHTHDECAKNELEEEIAECSDQLQTLITTVLRAGTDSELFQTYIQVVFRRLAVRTFGKDAAAALHLITDRQAEIYIRLAKEN